MNMTMKPLADVTQEALAVLRRELGVVDTLRFLRQFRAGAGNYTEERDARERDLSVEEIFAEARRRQAVDALR
jgi:hypothetical protein